MIAGVYLLSLVTRWAARASHARRARDDVGSIVDALREAAREAGFTEYGIEWSLGDTAVILNLAGGPGAFGVAARGRTRAEAVAIALEEILGQARREAARAATRARAGDAFRGAGTGRDGSEQGRAERPRSPPPDPGPRPGWWREALELGHDASRADVDRAWRRLARRAHPDVGGTKEAMATLNAAREEARRVLGQGGLHAGAV